MAAPATPVAPMAPVAPVAPMAPVAPVAPVTRREFIQWINKHRTDRLKLGPIKTIAEDDVWPCTEEDVINNMFDMLRSDAVFDRTGDSRSTDTFTTIDAIELFIAKKFDDDGGSGSNWLNVLCSDEEVHRETNQLADRPVDLPTDVSGN